MYFCLLGKEEHWELESLYKEHKVNVNEKAAVVFSAQKYGKKALLAYFETHPYEYGKLLKSYLKWRKQAFEFIQTHIHKKELVRGEWVLLEHRHKSDIIPLCVAEHQLPLFEM